MSIPATEPLPLPDLARLRPRQQMAMDCALCARFYACEPCLDRLKAQALTYFMERRPTSA